MQCVYPFFPVNKDQALSVVDQSLARLPRAQVDLVNGIAGSAIPENEPDSIKRILEAVRKHLGMEIAYVSKLVGDRTELREVDAPGFEHHVKSGDSFAYDDSYCRYVLEGRLPQLITDTALYPVAAALPFTAAMPVVAHMSVPVYLSDGSAYGMFCCLSAHANPTLTLRDLQVMKVFADMVAHQINDHLLIETDLSEASERIGRVIAHNAFKIVCQPILTLAPHRLVGFEALCRFTPKPYRPPDQWFGEAARVGLGVELELAAMRMALGAFRVIQNDLFIAVNVSPETVLSSGFIDEFRDCPKSRLVLEITEHTEVDDYGALLAALAPLRAQGARLSIDDAGAGFASLKHILNLNPDIVKLDIGLTKAIDIDPARRALAAALVFFAEDTDSLIIAEGVETESELTTLKNLGIPMGQGYFLGRPADLATTRSLCQSLTRA
jgi:EAL domain-containing protein (putative c-di-GMP-specific phosphodiesterase class I)